MQDSLKVRGPDLLPALRLHHLDPKAVITPVSPAEEAAPRQGRQPSKEKVARYLAARAAMGPFIDSLDDGTLFIMFAWQSTQWAAHVS
jgi:hypothetical protein